jgi:hypothetical protein
MTAISSSKQYRMGVWQQISSTWIQQEEQLVMEDGNLPLS